MSSGATVVAVLTTQGSKIDLSQVRGTIALVEQALDQSDLSPVYEQGLRRASSQQR